MRCRHFFTLNSPRIYDNNFTISLYYSNPVTCATVHYRLYSVLHTDKIRLLLIKLEPNTPVLTAIFYTVYKYDSTSPFVSKDYQRASSLVIHKHRLVLFIFNIRNLSSFFINFQITQKYKRFKSITVIYEYCVPTTYVRAPIYN